jgi:hypothetical protein
MPHLATAGNTVVPAVLALESLGFTLSSVDLPEAPWMRAVRGEDSFIAPDPVALLGLIRLVELRGWKWAATDAEIENTLQRSELRL